jgi:hypothetical protein
MKDMNQFVYDRWMDMPMLKDQWLTLPCGHTVSREHLRIAGGVCPTCEQDKDVCELGEFPPRRDI